MPDYLKGKIYKIVNFNNDKIYIGSTCEATLARRLTCHVSKYKSFLNGKEGIYLTSFEILKEENYDIQLIENYPCETKDELHAREGYYIKTLDCVNKIVAGRCYKDYCEDNKIKLQERSRQYYKENNEKICKVTRQYKIDNQDKVKKRAKQYRIKNDDKIKQYWIDNKDKFKQNRKDYYEENKEEIIQRQMVKINCECGITYTHGHKSRHFKTIKHLNYINEKTKLEELEKELNNI
jgi:hypothetical protein